VMADSRVSVLRTTFVFCFLPTSNHPSPSVSAPGETGRCIERSSCALPLERGLVDGREGAKRERRIRSSSCSVFRKNPRYSSASS
jgi:hypothetical protein